MALKSVLESNLCVVVAIDIYIRTYVVIDRSTHTYTNTVMQKYMYIASLAPHYPTKPGMQTKINKDLVL